MRAIYISLPSFRFWLLRVVLIGVLILIERAVGYPVISLTVCLWIAAKISLVGRIGWLLLIGIILAILYQWAFWMPIGLLLLAQFGLEHISSSWLKRELVIAAVAIFLNGIFLLYSRTAITNQVIFQVLVLLLAILLIDHFQARLGRGIGRTTWLRWYEQHRD